MSLYVEFGWEMPVWEPKEKNVLRIRNWTSYEHEHTQMIENSALIFENMSVVFINFKN
jgi:hypothetical protein